MRIGAIADDLTGATDLSLTLAAGGFRVVQVSGVPGPELAAAAEGADAVVVALKSRTIPADQAVEMSLAAARALLAAGAGQLFFKYCSTFDSNDAGNIGPVTSALMALLGTGFTIACPAFPANGRRVFQGHLFVGDRLLSESSMKDHPLTPMRDADLVRVLARQTDRKVTLIPHQTVAGGHEALAAAFAGAEGIAIVDAVSDADLRCIGTAARGLQLVTGGSGIALGIPASHGFAPRGAARPISLPPGGAVCLAGSCSAATRGQIAAALAAGMPALRLDPAAITDGRMTPQIAASFVQAQPPGLAPLVYSSADPAEVAQVQQQLGREAAGALVEAFLADLARLLADQGYNRFVVAGGETSGAVVAALEASVLEIGPEIDPGVPWTTTAGARPLALALKSGNFGAPDFFLKAWELVA